MSDDLGDRMKEYEAVETGQRFMPLLPVVVRLDGRSFSSFTSGMNKPYDIGMVNAMMETTKCLVEETGAVVGYTQSDEITLVLYSGSHDSQIWFDGKKFKIVSSAAALCSVVFAKLIAEGHPELGGKCPTFDCRAFNVPCKTEAANAVLWRELDATKNAISSAARHYYSHRELQDKTGPQKQEMLFAKGVNFDKYPPFFKRGTWVQRKKSSRRFSIEEIEKLPPKHEARTNPDLVVERTDVDYLDMPPFSKVINREGVIFDGEEPVTAGVQV